ncbi:MAG TPA: rhomboid family intramembrane serine protease [Rhizomicrobium sp.]|nr:rhomboid family intramembrane serine protease [Rhizomicrobium sp.]
MAFFQESRPAREPFLRAPASVLILIGVLVAAHIGRVFAPDPAAITEHYALNPAVYAQALKSSGAALPSLSALLIPPFSHMFLHANVTHLAFNCIWLLVFGSVVARRFGTLGFYIFFFVCGLAGAAAFVLMDWGDSNGAIGASGAISGLMGAGIRMLRIREPWLQGATLPLVPLTSSQVLLYSVLWLVMNIAVGKIGIGPMGEAELIAWQAHVGGYLAGLLLAGPFDLYFGPRPNGA